MINMENFMTTTAREAGNIAVDYLGKTTRTSKGPKDVVTEADVAVEKYIVGKIKEKYPEHGIVGEESGKSVESSEYVWYIDPIDGTSNYSHSDPNFAVVIALAKKGEVIESCIYLPMLDEMYYAKIGEGAYCNGEKITVSEINLLKDSFVQLGISPKKDTVEESLNVVRHFSVNADRVRDYGFCAGQLAYVAKGRAEVLMKISQYPWDIAAGMLLVSEAGGKVTDEKGNKISFGKKERYNIVATNGKIHDKVIDEIKKIDVNTDVMWW